MFKAGKYYVGDLCYVMNKEWDEVCSLLYSQENGKSNEEGGELVLSNGVQIGILQTEYGDGTYFDGDGNDYSVDSGTIGCILMSDISDEVPDVRGGNIIDFKEDFEINGDSGILTFGHIEIDTRD